jgi:hypothetical protein
VTEEGAPTPIRRKKPGPAERARLRAERAQAAGEAPPARTPKPPAGRRSRLEVQTGAMLMQMNLGFTMTCAMVQAAGGPLDPATDPLQPNEIVLLARGVAIQAEGHAQFRKYLTYLLNVSGGAGLLSVVAAIVVTRLAQHGVIPETAGGFAQLALMADPRDVAAATAAMAEAPPAEDEVDAA